MQFNLLVTLYESLIIVLGASTLARNFIMLKTETKVELLPGSLSFDNDYICYDLQR